MNRWATSSLAFAIGLGGAFAAVSASQPTDGRANGDLLGSADLGRYCRDVFGSKSVASLVQDHAYGWKCSVTRNELFGTKPMDVERACGMQFGEPSYADPWDSDFAYSWECFYGRKP